MYSLVGKCDTFWQLCVVGARYCCFGRDKGNKHPSPEEDSGRGQEGVLVGAHYIHRTYGSMEHTGYVTAYRYTIQQEKRCRRGMYEW